MTAPPSSISVESESKVLPSSTLSLTTTFNRFQPSPETVVLILAVVIGSGTGFAVVLFHYLIETIHSLMMEDVMGVIGVWGPWTLACIPSIGGLLVGLMRWRWKDFGPGFASLIAVAKGARNVLPLRALAKAIAAAISLGTGASLGPEGPSVEIGANVGIFLGQMLQVSQERQRLLLGAGAAAGLAAGFNAPIAGVFFALEVVLGTTFATSAVSVVLLAAVVAALIAQIGQGGQPPFTLPSYEVRSPLELPLYLGLGLFASIVAIAYMRAIRFAQRAFEGALPGLSVFNRVPMVLRPVMGGVCVGVVALWFPQTLGVGYETIEAMLHDVQFSLPLLLGLLLVKLIMTAVSLGSGLVGGLFAPAMFLGASLGAAYGKILGLVLPIALGGIAAPPAYAMVGMAAVLAASARAPLTAILLLFELTRDYRIILPLMAAVGLSVWLAERLQPIARNAETLQSIGLNLQPDQSAAMARQLLVAQAMQEDLLTLSSSVSSLQAGLALIEHQSHSAMVLDEGDRLIGIITLQDIQKTLSPLASEANQPLTNGNQPIRDICTRDLLYAYDDEPVSEALARMGGRGLRQLPVVNRNAPHRLLGLLNQEHVNLMCGLSTLQKSLHLYMQDMQGNQTALIQTTTAEVLTMTNQRTVNQLPPDQVVIEPLTVAQGKVDQLTAE